MDELTVKCLNCGDLLKWNKGAHIDYYTCRRMTMSCQFFSKMPVKAAERLAKLQALDETAIEHGGRLHLAGWALGVGKKNLGKQTIDKAISNCAESRVNLDNLCLELNQAEEERLEKL